MDGRRGGRLDLLADALVGAAVEVERGVRGVAARSARTAAPAANLVLRRDAVRRPLQGLERRVRRLGETGHSVRRDRQDAGAALLHRVVAWAVAEVIAEVDVDAVVDRVDLDRVINRLDLDSIVARVQIDPVVQRVDVNAVAQRLDVDAMLDEMDVPAIARHLVEAGDIETIIRESTTSVGGEMVDALRMKGAVADRVVNRLVDAILLRRKARLAGDGEVPGDVPGMRGAAAES